MFCIILVILRYIIFSRDIKTFLGLLNLSYLCIINYNNYQEDHLTNLQVPSWIRTNPIGFGKQNSQ
jgi:hypothetical protein